MRTQWKLGDSGRAMMRIGSTVMVAVVDPVDMNDEYRA
jgi:hypothetical protein